MLPDFRVHRVTDNAKCATRFGIVDRNVIILQCEDPL